MSELENFGRFLIRELRIDRDPDWEYLRHKYKRYEIKSKQYGQNYINYIVAKMYDVPSSLLLLPTKKQESCLPRHMAQLGMRLCGYGNQEIAKYYQCHHATVSLNIKKIYGYYPTNRQIREKVDKLREKLL